MFHVSFSTALPKILVARSSLTPKVLLPVSNVHGSQTDIAIAAVDGNTVVRRQLLATLTDFDAKYS